MTIDAPSRATASAVLLGTGAGTGAVSGDGSSADLVAGLWEEAPFSRLPWDAPAELRRVVAEVVDPRGVYTIHRASRRHNFQLLVQKYIVQLRQGCGVSSCCNPTCLSCRKRVAGRTPLRRYNTTSARTLAIHLASQDNPEAGLCPALRLPKTPPAALSSLVFSPKYVPPAPGGGGSGSGGSFARGGGPSAERFRATKNGKGVAVVTNTPSAKPVSAPTPAPAPAAAAAAAAAEASQRKQNARDDKWEEHTEEPKFTLTDKPVSKDYRSFAANMFGTVAFKMLEWLTPSAVAEMTNKAEQLQTGPSSAKAKEDSRALPPQTADGDKDAQKAGTAAKGLGNGIANSATSAPAKKPTTSTEEPDEDNLPHPGPPATANGSAQRSTSALVRAPVQTTQPQRKASADALPDESGDLLPPLRSPGLSAIQGSDGLLPKPTAAAAAAAAAVAAASKSRKTTGPSMTRPISQLSNAGFFDDVSLEKMPSPLKSAADTKAKSNPTAAAATAAASRVQIDLSLRSGSDSSQPQSQSQSSSSRSLSSDRSSYDQSSAAAAAVLPGATDTDGAGAEDVMLDELLPQTLVLLTAGVIDFLCDVLQEDRAGEPHLLEPPTVDKFHLPHDGQPQPLERTAKRQLTRQEATHLRTEWRLFIEQSLFYVLGRPRPLLFSFTRHGQLYDTQSLWYCMLRLTRAAPSLVLHSLWSAAEVLFEPPKALRRQPPALLTDRESGMLMAICLHALVAMAPVVDDERKLYDISRIRAQGMTLAGSGDLARQSPQLCLQYDDAFSNDLALRLARRLFAAIPARRFYADLAEHRSASLADAGSSISSISTITSSSSSSNSQQTAAPGSPPVPDILAPLFAQLDYLNTDAAYVLDFTLPARTLHETRVPSILLDWARTVMLSEWSGSPLVPGDGAFGGALALTTAIYERRHDLLVGEIQCRTEYFAERLDEVEVPMAWLSFTSTRQMCHLLDFPYLFSPATLVSYFRAINFSRMSRAFEESSSLQSRMNAIISPESLVVNPHHKTVLQDMLRIASTKYLVLDIGRQTVLQDAFDQLWRRERRELLRPLKVHLGESGGEEGFDSGGVQQEFFRLALAEALNPDYGAFTVDSRTRMAWFNPTTLEEGWKFELVGLLVSLALYNGLSVPVTFPRALYRKLLGEPVNELHHIADGWPELTSGLTALLEWNEQDGAVEDVFVRSYEFSVDLFGKPVSRVMGPSAPWPQIREGVLGTEAEKKDTKSGGEGVGGDAEGMAVAEGGSLNTAPASASATAPAEDEAPMVTNENRNAYVTDYISYLTDVSVRPQYEAFARGFRACLHPKSLRLLSGNLLQTLVEGQQDIDMEELRRHARYVGWDANHRAVRDFWSVVSCYDDAMKRRLLEFVTASDRVPVGGIKNVQFVVQRNGAEEGRGGHLPTAYTCYGTLLLPEYRDREVLQERLAMALENTQGFGFA